MKIKVLFVLFIFCFFANANNIVVKDELVIGFTPKMKGKKFTPKQAIAYLRKIKGLNKYRWVADNQQQVLIAVKLPNKYQDKPTSKKDRKKFFEMLNKSKVIDYYTSALRIKKNDAFTKHFKVHIQSPYEILYPWKWVTIGFKHDIDDYNNDLLKSIFLLRKKPKFSLYPRPRGLWPSRCVILTTVGKNKLHLYKYVQKWNKNINVEFCYFTPINIRYPLGYRYRAGDIFGDGWKYLHPPKPRKISPPPEVDNVWDIFKKKKKKKNK